MLNTLFNFLLPSFLFGLKAFPSDLVRTKDWGTEILTDSDLEGQIDLVINWVMAAMNSSTGHKHDATSNEGPKIDTSGLADDGVTFAKIDDDGDFGLFTGDWSFNEIALVEDTAPTTAAGEMKLYTKDTSGQPELFVREESDGDEVQITSGGSLNGLPSADEKVKGWAMVTYSGGTPTLQDSFNVSGIVDDGVGLLTVTWDTNFANTNYVIQVCAKEALGTAVATCQVTAQAAGTCQVGISSVSGSQIDPDAIYVVAYGDQ